MSRYKGYLTGVNPNYVRKLVQDEDPRYFAYESTTGTFVNGRGEEVKSMKEAVAINDKIDAELKLAFPPQKAVGAKPVRKKGRASPVKSYIALKTSNDDKTDDLFTSLRGYEEFNKAHRQFIEDGKKLDAQYKQIIKKPVDPDMNKGLSNILVLGGALNDK